MNLVLAANQIAELADLDVLGRFAGLTHLVLVDNPVTKKDVSCTFGWGGWGVLTGGQHYRYWVLWRCPSVRFLDYQKVKDAERNKARELFGTPEEMTELANKVRTSLRVQTLVLGWADVWSTDRGNQVQGV